MRWHSSPTTESSSVDVQSMTRSRRQIAHLFPDRPQRIFLVLSETARPKPPSRLWRWAESKSAVIRTWFVTSRRLSMCLHLAVWSPTGRSDSANRLRPDWPRLKRMLAEPYLDSGGSRGRGRMMPDHDPFTPAGHAIRKHLNAPRFSELAARHSFHPPTSIYDGLRRLRLKRPCTERACNCTK